MATIHFDIIIPLYNRASLVGETLQSLLDQTYPNWHAWVVDDGSSDDSVEVAKEFAAKSGDRMKVVQRPEAHSPGGSGARNYGTALGISPWLIFLDSDDVFTPEALAIREEEVARHPEADMVVFPSAMFFKVPGDSMFVWNFLHTSSDDLIRFLSFDTPWQTAGPVWKRSSFNKLGGFDESVLSYQDWELHLRAVLNKLTIAKLSKPETAYHHFCRISESGESISNKGDDSTIIANRLMLFEKVRLMLKGKGRAQWHLFSMYYQEATLRKARGLEQTAELFQKAAKSFPYHWQIWWRMNDIWKGLMVYELRYFAKLPIPKPFNRLYNWKRLKSIWLGRHDMSCMRKVRRIDNTL